jgi:CHASE2 domain-containing sensor protein
MSSMSQPDGEGRPALRALAAAAMALAGLAFAISPLAEHLDNGVLDAQWLLLRAYAPKDGPADIVVVGVDDATLREIPMPPGLWHEPLGRALVRIAAARPRAVALDFPLPERSYEAIHPGLDRALFAGLVAAGRNGPFVASLNIDPATRSARRIHTPFLVALGEERLGVGLAAVDGDGVTRRFSLRVPTEDGGFPTLVGRLCRAMSKGCSDGLIDFAIGPPLLYVPLQNVLAASDNEALARLFSGKVVLIGQALKHADRIKVPVNLAGWESGGGDSPAIVVHGLTLRTALAGSPQEAARPAVVLGIGLAATLVLLRSWRRALVLGLLGGGAFFLATLWQLRGGHYFPAGTVLAVVAAAVGAVAIAAAWRRKAAAGPNIQHNL